MATKYSPTGRHATTTSARRSGVLTGGEAELELHAGLDRVAPDASLRGRRVLPDHIDAHSPIMMTAALVLPETTVSMIEASTTAVA